MTDLVERLPKMLRKNAELDATEGEYHPSEHIEWMAADRIEELEATALKWADSSLQKTERIEELEAELNRAKNDPGLFFTGDRDILEQNQKIKAECERLREFLERGGIDSSAVLAGEDTGEWQDQNERLRAVLVEVHRLVSYAQHRDAINLINKALAAVEEGESG